MSELGDFFRQNLAQTSDAPIGLEISRAEGSWLVASDGRRYLDFIAGIGVSALGHGHPEVLDAIAAQARRHLHVMVYGEYVIESQVMLARRLVELLPRPLERVYFTNSGAEAIECALKVARKFTGRAGFVAFDGAYHGDTMGALALAGNRAMREPFGASARAGAASAVRRRRAHSRKSIRRSRRWSSSRCRLRAACAFRRWGSFARCVNDAIARARCSSSTRS